MQKSSFYRVALLLVVCLVIVFYSKRLTTLGTSGHRRPHMKVKVQKCPTYSALNAKHDNDDDGDDLDGDDLGTGVQWKMCASHQADPEHKAETLSSQWPCHPP